MYKYPYGDSQQLNLDWILAKLKELEASGGSGGADLEEVSNALISLTYNTSTAYRRYDYAFLNGKLYRCLSDTSGVFNPSVWQEALIGDDLSVLTRWINAIDAAAVVDVKFDTSGTNGKIQQKYHDQYHDVVEVDYTPVQNSKRPLSSNAGYELNGAINTFLIADTTWEQGSISGTGADTESTTRIRTKNYIPVTNVVSVSGVIDSGYMFSVTWYDSSKTFIGDNGWYNTTAKVEKPANATFCRIIFAFSNSTTITPAESSHIEVRLDMTVKNAINIVNDKAKYDIYDEGIYAYNNPILAAYTTASGNYIDFFMPIKVNPKLTIVATYEQSYRHEGDMGDTHTVAYLLDNKIDATVAMNANITIVKRTESGLTFEIGFTNTQTPSKPATICVARLVITATR